MNAQITVLETAYHAYGYSYSRLIGSQTQIKGLEVLYFIQLNYKSAGIDGLEPPPRKLTASCSTLELYSHVADSGLEPLSQAYEARNKPSHLIRNSWQKEIRTLIFNQLPYSCVSGRVVIYQ